MRAEGDGDGAPSEAGWPRRTETEGDAAPEEEADVTEDEATVRKAIDDDTSASAFAERDPEEQCPLAPEFREPEDTEKSSP